jgi:hypothetical protein
VKLWVAAADDPDLFARLVPVERMLAQALARLIAELAGDELLNGRPRAAWQLARSTVPNTAPRQP